MNEHELLERLDERAAAAAADLRAAAARRPIPEFDTEGVRLTRLPDQSRRRFTRPLVGIAAAVVLLAGAGGWWVAVRDDSAPDQTNTPETPTPVEPRPFVATELPDGMAMTAAFDLLPAYRGPPLGPATIYGPSDTEPGLVVYVLDQWSRLMEVDSLERFELDGREAYVGRLSVGGGGTHVVVPIEGDRAVVAGGPSFGRDELMGVATRTTVDGLRATVPKDALPGEWRPLVEADAMGLLSPFSTHGGGPGTGHWTFYADERAEGYAVLSSLVGDESRMFAATLFAERVEETTVREHQALVIEYQDTAEAAARFDLRVVMVTWLEKPGELVQLSGEGFSKDELLSIAEGIRPVSADEFADLVERSALGGLDADPADTVGEGQFADGSRWILRQTPDGSTPDLSVAIAGKTDGESSMSSSGGGSTSSEAGFMADTIMEKEGRTFAGGFVSENVVTVELRRPDGSVLGHAEIVTGAGHIGWVTELDAPATVAVAVDANGDEVARTTLTKSDSSIRGETESIPMSEYIDETGDSETEGGTDLPLAPAATSYVDPRSEPTGDD